MSSNPGVKGDIPLNLISDADLKRAADKIRQAKKLKEEANKLSPIGTALAPGGPAEPRSSTGPLDRKSAISGGRTNNAFREMQQKLAKAEKEIADAKKAAEKAKKEQDKKIKDLRSEVKSLIDSGGDILTNPEAAIQENILALASKFGPAGLAIALGPQLIDLVLSQFEDGGIFDTRVKEIQQATSMAAVEYLVDIQSGTVMFNQSAYLTDEPAGIANTDKLVSGQQRYFLLNSGSYVGFTN